MSEVKQEELQLEAVEEEEVQEEETIEEPVETSDDVKEELKKDDPTDAEIIAKAFAPQRRSNMTKEFKPVSKSKLFSESKKKKEDIIVPLEVDGEIEYLVFRPPTNRDHALAGGRLFRANISDDGEIQTPDPTDTKVLDNTEQYQKALFQRILKEPSMTLAEVERLDYEGIVIYCLNKVDDEVKGQLKDIKSFRKLGKV